MVVIGIASEQMAIACHKRTIHHAIVDKEGVVFCTNIVECLHVSHWKENFPGQKYVFLEGKVFQLKKFTMDGFSFQLVFSLKIGRFYQPS